MLCQGYNCDRAAVAKSLCKKHWKRQRNGGDVSQKSAHEKTISERFWGKVNIKGEDECWLWMASTKGYKGMEYGSFGINYKNITAHRYSWILANGEIPEGGDIRGMCVLHSCDTPLCVNPKHLSLGTHTDNMRDKINKGRCPIKNKTHCPQGHEYTFKNTHVTKKGLRMCRTCSRNREREKQRRLKLCSY